MSGILSGKHAGFLSEEIFTEDVNTEAVDGDLLAEELEKAQEDLFIEQEKFNTAIEAECETNETVDEIEAALESGSTDVVYAKLLVNKLIKNNSIFYGNSKPLVSALESDRGSDARSILQAGLEDGKGMVNAIKEFIAKVWQKIKDAFAWVWKKMKDFWAWLTGASKKVEEKKEETVVAASAVNAAVDKSDEIKKATENVSKTFEQNASEVEAKLDNLIDELEKFTSYLPTNSETTNNVIENGKFKGRKIKDLTSDECFEWMSENQEKIVEAVTGNIIVEEVSKQTGLAEKKVANYISPAMMKNMKVFAFDPSLISRLTIIISKNIDSNSKKITDLAMLPMVLSACDRGFNISGFSISKYEIFEDLESWKLGKFKSLEQDFENNFNNNWKQARSFASLLDWFLNSGNSGVSETMEKWRESFELSARNLIDFIKNSEEGLSLKNYRDRLTDDSKTQYQKTFAALTPVSINGLEVSYINALAKSTIKINFPAEVSSGRISDKFIDNITSIDIGSSVKNYNGSNDLMFILERLIKTSDEALANTLKYGEESLYTSKDSKLKNETEWKKRQSHFLRLISNVGFYNPVTILNTEKNSLIALKSIMEIIDIHGAIAQASKEFDSSKFKFDKK